MKPLTKDMIGQRFGLLLVTAYHPEPNPNMGAMWVCDCACGNTGTIHAARGLRRGDIISCGCMRGKRTQRATPELEARAQVKRERALRHQVKKRAEARLAKQLYPAGQ